VLAGYGTTSKALANIAHVLATHPDEQLKIQQYIDAYFESENKNDMPSYDTVSQMEYLHIFVR
jgi:cytochrome P450